MNIINLLIENHKYKLIISLILLFIGIMLIAGSIDTNRYGRYGGIYIDSFSLALGVIFAVSAFVVYFQSSSNPKKMHPSIIIIIRKGDIVTVKKSDNAQHVILTVLEEGFGKTSRKDW